MKFVSHEDPTKTVRKSNGPVVAYLELLWPKSFRLTGQNYSVALKKWTLELSQMKIQNEDSLIRKSPYNRLVRCFFRGNVGRFSLNSLRACSRLCSFFTWKELWISKSRKIRLGITESEIKHLCVPNPSFLDSHREWPFDSKNRLEFWKPPWTAYKLSILGKRNAAVLLETFRWKATNSERFLCQEYLTNDLSSK